MALKQCDPPVEAFTAYLKLRPIGKWTVRVEKEIARCRGPGGRHQPASRGIAHHRTGVDTTTATSDGKPLDGATVRIDGLIRGGAPLDLQMTPAAT